MRDYQRSRVYRWERAVIAPRDQSLVPFDQIPAIVDYLWPAPDHPAPAVKRLHPNEKRALAKGHRLRLLFGPSAPTWVIIHELAHALTCGNGHGPDFLGAYIHLVHQHLKIPLPELYFTAQRAKLRFNTSVRYNFSGDYL